MNAVMHCSQYLHIAEQFVKAREEYRLAYATAIMESQAKTEAQRKYEADTKTSELRVNRDKLEILAAVEWQQLLIARGPMTDSVQPLQKFGDR